MIKMMLFLSTTTTTMILVILLLSILTCPHRVDVCPDIGSFILNAYNPVYREGQITGKRPTHFISH